MKKDLLSLAVIITGVLIYMFGSIGAILLGISTGSWWIGAPVTALGLLASGMVLGTSLLLSDKIG